MKKPTSLFALLAIALLIALASPVAAQESAPSLGGIELILDWIESIWEAFNPTIVPTGEPAATPPPTPPDSSAPVHYWEAFNPTIVPTGQPEAPATPATEEGTPLTPEESS